MLTTFCDFSHIPQTYDVADPQNNVRVRHDNIESQDIDDMIQLRLVSFDLFVGLMGWGWR